MDFTIRTEVFEGPLELLLSLIEKRKLHISDISLAQVTDDYISYINTHTGIPVAESAQFILVASTLLLIKSKSLLPVLDLSEDEEADIKDLERRLKWYQRVRELALHLKAQLAEKKLFTRPRALPQEIVFSPSADLSKDTLREGIQRLIQALPKVAKVPEKVVAKVISLEEMVNDLTTRITRSLRMSFKEFTGSKKEKVHMIVGFLAMLELVKQGLIDVQQQEHFGDIEMETQEAIGVPQYE